MLFQKLSQTEIAQIVRLMLGATEGAARRSRGRARGHRRAIEWLGEHGYEPEYGARPLRRLIQREVDDRIADLFVTGDLGDGEAVKVDASDGTLTVASVPRAIAEVKLAA